MDEEEKCRHIVLTLPILSSFIESDEKDISKITEVALPNKNIEKCVDISLIKNLKRIDIQNNFIEDANFISLNLELRWINLQKNKISSMQFLQHLHLLTVLNLSHNQISDVTNLNSLKQLNTLILDHNQIKTAPKFELLPNLRILVLSHNYIEELKTPKRALPNLTKISISHNQLRSFPFCDKFSGLQELRLNSNKLQNLSDDGIVFMNALTILDVGNNNITKQECLLPLKSSVKLQNLNFAGNFTAEQTQILFNEFSNLPTMRLLNGKPIRDRNNVITTNKKHSKLRHRMKRKRLHPHVNQHSVNSKSMKTADESK